MNLLSRLLAKRGIEKVDDLDLEEQATFKQWEKILSDSEISVEKIAEFCKGQIHIIEGKWKANPGSENPKLITYHVIYKTLVELIEGPKAERENLERYLNQLLQQ